MVRVISRVLSVFVAAVFCFGISSGSGTAAINNQINFQGKLTNPDGTNASNGSYSIRFRIYSDASADASNPCSANSCKWEETQSAVSVSDGVFRVSLGSVVPLTSVDFNSPDLYLGIRIGGDQEMTPRVKFTAAPYALNSEKLNGLGSSNFVQLGQGLQVDSSTSTSIAINKTSGSGSILDLQHAGATAFLVANDGSASFYDSAGAIALLRTDAGSGEVVSGNGTVTVGADGSITRIIAAGKTAENNLNSGSQSQFIAVDTQTDDLVLINNTGQEPTTDNANGLHINYGGGNAAVEGSGMRIDYTPGGTAGGQWGGVRIVAATNGAASGVEAYGLKLEGPVAPGSGTDSAVKIASGWDIGLDIGSGGLQLSTQSDPVAPAAGNLRLYAKTVSGRTLLKAMGSSGVDYPLQPSLFQNQVSVINVQSGTASNYFGTNRSVTGTAVAAAYDEDYGYMSGYSTGTTANTSAGIGNTSNQFARGSKVGANGFFMNIRGALKDSDYSTSRIFVGMTDRGVNQAVNNQNQAGDRVGFSYDTGRGDTNWQITTRDGSTESLSDTGVAFAASKAYDWYLYVPPYPNNGTIYWRIDNKTDNTSAEGSVTSNLPDGSTALKAAIVVRNLSGVSRSVSYQRIYVESDR